MKIYGKDIKYIKPCLEVVANKYYEIGVGSAIKGKFKKKLEIEETDIAKLFFAVQEEKIKTLKELREELSGYGKWGLSMPEVLMKVNAKITELEENEKA